MPDRRKSISPALPQDPPPLDLARYSEVTRRALYDLTVQVHFSPTPKEIAKAKKNDEWYEKYTAEECDLTVLYLAGRWFAYWRIWELETENAPEDQHWEVLRIQYSESNPNRPAFYGV